MTDSFHDVSAFLESLQDAMHQLGEMANSHVRRGNRSRRPFLVLSGRPFVIHMNSSRREYRGSVGLGFLVTAADRKEYELSIDLLWDSQGWTVQASVAVESADGGQEPIREGRERHATDVAGCVQMLREALDDLREFQTVVPSATPIPDSEPARGEAIAAAWNWLRTAHDEPRIRIAAQAASQRSAFARYFPFVSVNRLRLSRTTEYPYSLDLPYLVVEDDYFEARAGDGEPLARGDIESVLDAVSSRMPDSQ